MYLLTTNTIMITVKLTNIYIGLYQLHYFHVFSSLYLYNNFENIIIIIIISLY